MDALDAFLDELRAAGSAVDAPVPSDALQVLFRDGTVETPPFTIPAPPRRRPLLRVAVAGAAASFVFGGLGVAGALPAPVQDGVANVADFVGVNLPDGNPGHGGEPPAAPQAGDHPRQNQENEPGTVDDEHRQNGDAPAGQGDDRGDNGRHLGQDGSVPSTVPEGRANADASNGNTGTYKGSGTHNGWDEFPPASVAVNTTKGPPESAQDNPGGNS